MSDSSASLPVADRDEFHRHRFEVFRSFAIRLGFFVSFLFVLTFILDWISQPAKAIHWLPVRILTGLALATYPAALVWGASRKILPWVLYGTILIGMLIRLASELGGGRYGFDDLWIGFYFFIGASMLGLPLRRMENVIGLLTLALVPNLLGLFQRSLVAPILQFDKMILPLVAFLIYVQHHINILVETLYTYQNQIKALAHRDALTGVFNRRHFMEAADLMLKRAKRTKFPICLVILDIDHFKSVNDRFGHPVGDLVIKETARALVGAFRETDLVARLGGEEFVALLSDSDQVAGVQAAERVREALEGTEVLVEGLPEPVRVTASLGVAVMQAEGETVDAMLERADQGLYAAKRGGRNRVEYQAFGGSNDPIRST